MAETQISVLGLPGVLILKHMSVSRSADSRQFWNTICRRIEIARHASRPFCPGFSSYLLPSFCIDFILDAGSGGNGLST